MADINLPSGFGGLTRYNEEYPSKVKISPIGVILMVVVVVGLVIALNIFFPVK